MNYIPGMFRDGIISGSGRGRTVILSLFFVFESEYSDYLYLLFDILRWTDEYVSKQFEIL